MVFMNLIALFSFAASTQA
jgi:hypothetical protein